MDISGNDITGTIPSPLPQSMTYFAATDASLTGRLPDLREESSMRQLLLGGNALEGEHQAIYPCFANLSCIMMV